MAAKKAAPKKVAAKKAASKKSTPKAAPKKKTAAKKSAPAKKKSATTPLKKSPAKKKSSAKKTASTSKAKMPGETSDTGAFVDNDANTTVDETITNNDINNSITPEAQEGTAVFSGSQPDQKWMPDDLKTSPHDSFHGNINPSKAKTGVKPSGKKPLWDSRK
ncbi:hypothetical protein [Niabella ginsengisoli]|uniref:Histone n=1 Tax=Niabella ginsengisoli TaxID=522298 RepID=A0ABS9SE60_9BACT|nr:hypothetical protein [Niabella ginsengisoli]MCH5596643.1 hypothetical protein [Niabella ginsengisoli]